MVVLPNVSDYENSEWTIEWRKRNSWELISPATSVKVLSSTKNEEFPFTYDFINNAPMIINESKQYSHLCLLYQKPDQCMGAIQFWDWFTAISSETEEFTCSFSKKFAASHFKICSAIIRQKFKQRTEKTINTWLIDAASIQSTKSYNLFNELILELKIEYTDVDFFWTFDRT